jgi:catechol 2,3-dioxygenase-like lactoylglutathione lyase family enzyme
MEIPAKSKLRVARPTDRLEEVVQFYRDELGFPELERFADHDGFDGVILGMPGAPYHLEFTHCRNHHVGRAPSQDCLLVFYMPDRESWLAATQRIEAGGRKPVVSLNPYWDRFGRTYEDPDGYRVVLYDGDWNR